MKSFWDLSKRMELEQILRSKTVTIAATARILGIGRTALYKELKLGLTEEDYKAHRWERYSAEMADIEKRKQILFGFGRA